MAKAKSNVKTALAKRPPPGALAPWQAEMQEEANKDAAKFQQGVARISFQGGSISVDGKDVGREAVVMISEAVFGKAYYEKTFKPGQAQVPVCYAFHPDEPAQMIPHEAAPNKQHTQCTGCKWNRFKTAILADGTKGDGKRCKDEVRVMCAVGDNDPDSILAAEFRMASIPPGSLKAWGQYVKKLKDMGKTFRGVLTKIKVVPFKGAYKVEFDATDDLDEKQYLALKSRRDTSREEMMQPYPDLANEEDKKPTKRVKGQD